MVVVFRELLHIPHPYSFVWQSVDLVPFVSIDLIDPNTQDCDSNSGSDFDDQKTVVFEATVNGINELLCCLHF